jgi:hypothetical protein
MIFPRIYVFIVFVLVNYIFDVHLSKKRVPDPIDFADFAHFCD